MRGAKPPLSHTFSRCGAQLSTGTGTTLPYHLNLMTYCYATRHG